MKRRGLPRLVEALVAGLALLLTLPTIALAAAAVALTSPGSPLFRQKRMGARGVPFVMYKLRTMRPTTGARVTKAGDPRVTRVGGVLRRWKIDELPELWNVVKGDMRLVGPRPEVPELVDMRNILWQEALAYPPGVTDPVTLRLRDEEQLLEAIGSGWQDFYRTILQPYKLQHYLEYQRHRTWRSDVSVLCQTGQAVLRLTRRQRVEGIRREINEMSVWDA
jgi:lipopolysaccharide/colanic/teichoic acid biosynthesis glycosyltransferase